MSSQCVKVVKFGGTSLADAKQLLKAKAIIEAEPERRYVVPSAPGKRFANDIKVTDMLYECYRLASEGENFSQEFGLIKEDIIPSLPILASILTSQRILKRLRVRLCITQVATMRLPAANT